MTQLSAASLERIEKIRSEVDMIVSRTPDAAAIVDADTEARAVEFLAQVKRRLKMVDEARTFLVKPLNDHVKEINAVFKQTSEPLEQAYETVRKAAAAYRSSEDMKEAARAKAEMVEQAKTAIREGDNAKIEDLAAGHAQIEAVAPKTVYTRTGAMSTRMDWKFEIVAPLEVTREYCSPDPQIIRAAVKGGERNIPGVRIWEEAVPIIRS